MRKLGDALILAFLAALHLGLGGPVVEKNKEGTRDYQAGQYDRALTSYVEAKSHAEEGSEDALRIHFNIGDALYQQGKYEEARKEYEQALTSENPRVKAQASYNLGNTFFKQAMQSRKVEDLEQAATYYTKALELDPHDQDAKFNLEVVRRHINLQKQPPPPSTCPNPQNKQDQKQQQDQQQGQQQQQEQEQEQQQAQPQPEPQPGTTAQKQPQPAQGQEGTPEEISKEEALRLLDALKEQEAEMQKARMYTEGVRPRAEKDW